MFPSPRRTLVQALTISLLIHAALLTSVVSLFPAVFDTPATTINVVMGRGSRSDAVMDDPSHSAKPLPANVKPLSPETANTGMRRDVVVKDVPAVRAVPSALTPVPDNSPSTSSLPVSVGAVASSGGAINAAPAREGPSADDMRQYRLSLATAARRFKRYPALARERGWEGTVEVALDINTLLPAPEIVLVRSSGRSVLDEQAREMLQQAARVTVLPEGLKGRDFRVLLPVKFSLDENQ